jgi:CRP-like cAMP-binding protein
VPARETPHERLSALGLRPIGRASEYADEVHALMSKTPLFSGLLIEETRRLCGFMFVYEAPVGVTLINEGDPGDFMVLLMDGMVDVLRRNRYNFPSRIAVAHAGHALGEMSMFDGEPRFATCIAATPVTFAALPRRGLERIMKDHPHLGQKILLQLVLLLNQRLRDVSGQLLQVWQQQA